MAQLMSSLNARVSQGGAVAHDLVEFVLCASSRDQIFSTSDSALSSETLITSSFNRWNDAAKRTRSFMRKATRSVIAGNPPADTAQPSGINGMIVDVAMKLPHAPKAPRTPSFLFQNPANKNAPSSHSETPKR